MKKILSVLFLLTIGLALSFQGCSDTQKDTPEPEPGPGGDTTVVVPPVQKWKDTVTMFKSIADEGSAVTFADPMVERRDVILKPVYNEEGLLVSFDFQNMDQDGRKFYYSDAVKVEWKEKSLIMKYDETGPEAVDGSGCVATYTLNDRRMLEKVEVITAAGKKEYKAVYTDLEFQLVDAATNKTLYSGKIDAGGTYGDWTTVTAAKHEGTTIKVGYSEVENQSGMDLFFMSHYRALGMPKCILWAHAAGLLPGSTKRFNKVSAIYDNKPVLLLYDMDENNAESSETRIALWYFDENMSDEIIELLLEGIIWEVSGCLEATYEIKIFEREGK